MYCASIGTAFRETAVRAVVLQPPLRRGYSASLKHWGERRLAEVRAALENFVFQETGGYETSEGCCRCHGGFDSRISNNSSFELANHQIVLTCRQDRLSHRMVPKKYGHVFEPIGKNNSAIDIYVRLKRTA
jgi:hypothetical protein